MRRSTTCCLVCTFHRWSVRWRASRLPRSCCVATEEHRPAGVAFTIVSGHRASLLVASSFVNLCLDVAFLVASSSVSLCSRPPSSRRRCGQRPFTVEARDLVFASRTSLRSSSSSRCAALVSRALGTPTDSASSRRELARICWVHRRMSMWRSLRCFVPRRRPSQRSICPLVNLFSSPLVRSVRLAPR